MRRYALGDDQWERLKDLLPGRKGTPGANARDNRLFVEAVLYRTRHTRWSKKGVWERVFKVLSEEADNEYAMIDSTIVRAHQHSAGAQKKTQPMIKG